MIRQLSAIIMEDLKDPVPSMLTFTRAEISKDLRHAKVYFSVLGNDQKIEACLQYLKRHAGIIKMFLGKRMHMKHMPDIRFNYANYTDNVLRVNKILRKLKDENNTG